MKTIENLSQKEKQKIYSEIIDCMSERDFPAFNRRLNTFETLDQKLIWLKRFKLFCLKNEDLINDEDIKVLKRNLIEDFGEGECEVIEQPDFDIKRAKTFSKALSVYGKFLGIENYIKFLEANEEIDFVRTNEKLESQKYPIKNDENSTVNYEVPSIIHSIPQRFRKEYFELFLNRKMLLIDAIIEIFPFKRSLYNLIDYETGYKEKPGRPTKYPVRREITRKFYKEKKEHLHSSINGYPSRNKIIEELKTQMDGCIDHIPSDTIADWIEEK
ncbi:hypothetical protein A8B79_05990 [Balneola sp. EhC07]|uniref:hypothetical protein n=1 Tax=Balneola sp. EhC07 TaxID=1849360 RepID=UPI0007F3D133|nr:hypothetical protein [Balneola sp. EhC07]OAN61024.1 hypothetical protein A8B79_05990 [Balneola sp. EhC07]